MTFDRADLFFFKAQALCLACMLSLACAIYAERAIDRLAAAAFKQQAAVRPVVLWKGLPTCETDDWLCILDNHQREGAL